MFRKIILVPLVLFGFVFFGMAGECFADVSAELEQAKSNVISMIEAGNYTEAQTQTQKLIADFHGNPDLPKVIYNIAEGYRWSTRPDKDKYEYARIFYQQVIQNYPDSAYADKAALGISRGKVQSLIISQDYDEAKEALDKMTADFSKNPNLHEALYWIGERYAWSDRYEQAKSIHQRIIRDYPDSSFVSGARLGYSKANVLSLIMSQDYDKADEALDKMIADFSRHPELPRAILAIGEQCYKQGLSKESDDSAQAKDLHEKAAEVWDRLINELPASFLTPEACCWAGDCYLKLGKHEDSIRCFQKVVDNYPEYEYAWHAQFTVGHCYEELKNTGVIEESLADAQIKAAYERVIQNYPDCPSAEYARAWVSRHNSK